MVRLDVRLPGPVQEGELVRPAIRIVPFSTHVALTSRIYQRPFGGQTIEYGKKMAQRICAAAIFRRHGILNDESLDAIRMGHGEPEAYRATIIL